MNTINNDAISLLLRYIKLNHDINKLTTRKKKIKDAINKKKSVQSNIERHIRLNHHQLPLPLPSPSLPSSSLPLPSSEINNNNFQSGIRRDIDSSNPTDNILENLRQNIENYRTILSELPPIDSNDLPPPPSSPSLPTPLPPPPSQRSEDSTNESDNSQDVYRRIIEIFLENCNDPSIRNTLQELLNSGQSIPISGSIETTTVFI